MTNFPKKLFVKLAGTDTGNVEDTYWDSREDCEELADEIGGVVDVGIYELVSTGKLATKAEFAADKVRARRK